MTPLKKIVSKVLGIEENMVRPELSRENTSEWDSFNHLLLISEVEKAMNIRFTMEEVGAIKNFEQLEKSAEKHAK